MKNFTDVLSIEGARVLSSGSINGVYYPYKKISPCPSIEGARVLSSGIFRYTKAQVFYKTQKRELKPKAWLPNILE